jgi:branched-chain amino acid transport system permease protein
LLQFIIVGLVLGSIYALAASGLVITYVSTGVLNFAFGAFAYFIARTYYWMHVEKGWGGDGWWGSILTAGLCIFVLAPLLGLVLYAGVFRFLRLSSQLIKVVVTIGFFVAIPQVSNMIYGTVEIFFTPGIAPEPVSTYPFLGTVISLNQIITYACVVGIVLVGALVLRFTDAGLSVRAMVDSEAMTSLSGSNPSRTAAGVWMVAMFLAGLSGILAAPVIGLDAGKFTLLTAAAFAAVIAGRLRNLPVAVVVALLMGVAGSLVQYYLPTDSQFTAAVIPSIPFIFIVISLVVNMALVYFRRTGAVNEEEGVGGALDRAITPHGGSRLAASVDVENPYPKLNFWFPVIIFAIVCGIGAILKPFWLSQLGIAATLAIVFLSFTLVTGEGGMLWLCQVAFAGVGAIGTAWLVDVWDFPLLLAILSAALIAAGIGVVIGLLTIRLGNLYIALVTLTFALLMERLVFTMETFAQNGVGRAITRPDFVADDRAFLYLTLGVFAVFAILIVNLRRSTTGLALNAVRWSETASRTMGLSVLQMKLLVSGLAAFVAGVGGALYAIQQKQAVPANYVSLAGLAWLAVLVTFGVRSNIAALLAGIGFTITPALLQSYTTPTWAQVPVLLFGVGAILLAKNPEGTVHMQAMQFQSALRRFGGARPVPAATGYAGRHDPRLAEHERDAGAPAADGREPEVGPDQPAEVTRP